MALEGGSKGDQRAGHPPGDTRHPHRRADIAGEGPGPQDRGPAPPPCACVQLDMIMQCMDRLVVGDDDSKMRDGEVLQPAPSLPLRLSPVQGVVGLLAKYFACRQPQSQTQAQMQTQMQMKHSMPAVSPEHLAAAALSACGVSPSVLTQPPQGSQEHALNVDAPIFLAVHALMRLITPNHFRPMRMPTESSTIACLQVWQDLDFSVCVFLLPRGARIPFHDHPGMCVISSVLQGSLLVQSFDWEPMSPSPTPWSRPEEELPDSESKAQPMRFSGWARLVHNEVVDAGTAPFALFPSHGGNIHQFYACCDTAVLDVMMPSYFPEGGRPCRYYAVREEKDQRSRRRRGARRAPRRRAGANGRATRGRIRAAPAPAVAADGRLQMSIQLGQVMFLEQVLEPTNINWTEEDHSPVLTASLQAAP